MQRLHDEFHTRGLTVLAVHMGPNDEQVEAFLRDFRPRLTFPIVFDTRGTVASTWRVESLPRSYVIDKAGRMVYVADGGRRMDSPHLKGLFAGLLDREGSDRLPR